MWSLRCAGTLRKDWHSRNNGLCGAMSLRLSRCPLNLLLERRNCRRGRGSLRRACVRWRIRGGFRCKWSCTLRRCRHRVMLWFVLLLLYSLIFCGRRLILYWEAFCWLCTGEDNWLRGQQGPSSLPFPFRRTFGERLVIGGDPWQLAGVSSRIVTCSIPLRLTGG